MNWEEAVKELTNNSESTTNVLWPAPPGRVESGNGESAIAVSRSFWPTPSGQVENGRIVAGANSASSSGSGKDPAAFKTAGQKKYINITSNSESTANVLWPAPTGQVERHSGKRAFGEHGLFWPTPSGQADNGTYNSEVNGASSSSAAFNSAGPNNNTYPLLMCFGRPIKRLITHLALIRIATRFRFGLHLRDRSIIELTLPI